MWRYISLWSTEANSVWIYGWISPCLTIECRKLPFILWGWHHPDSWQLSPCSSKYQTAFELRRKYLLIAGCTGIIQACNSTRESNQKLPGNLILTCWKNSGTGCFCVLQTCSFEEACLFFFFLFCWRWAVCSPLVQHYLVMRGESNSLWALWFDMRNEAYIFMWSP